MDFRGVIEFVKYTLALTAACFVYSLEKLVPQPTPQGQWAVLGLLIIFAVAAFGGVLIFAASTAALHGNEKRTKRLLPLVERAGYVHVFLLLVGLLGLSVMLVPRVFTEQPKPAQICCEPAGSTSTK